MSLVEVTQGECTNPNVTHHFFAAAGLLALVCYVGAPGIRTKLQPLEILSNLETVPGVENGRQFLEQVCASSKGLRFSGIGALVLTYEQTKPTHPLRVDFATLGNVRAAFKDPELGITSQSLHDPDTRSVYLSRSWACCKSFTVPRSGGTLSIAPLVPNSGKQASLFVGPAS